MLEGNPIKRLPKLLNPRRLAYSKAQIEGTIDAKTLQRLAEVADCNGDIRARLGFYVNESGKIIVNGNIYAALSYQCQRCMQMMPHQPHVADLQIAVVRDGEEAKQLPASLDPWIVEEEEGDVYALIEEELLLVTPVAAYHDYECIDVSLYSSGDFEDSEGSDKPNPFSVLGSLKKH